MKEWNYAFEAVSKDQWLQRIKSDLKNRSIESLAHEWWPDEKVFPVHHSEDLVDNPVILPDSLFTQPPKIIEWLPTGHLDSSEIQNSVQTALKSGVESLVFDIASRENLFEFQWLENVYTDMVDISISVDPSQVQSSPTGALDNIRTIRIRCGGHNYSLNDLVKTNKYPLEKFRFMYDISVTGNLINETTGGFQRLIDDVSTWRSMGFEAIDYLNKCILVITPGRDFFKQIIHTRVMHVLWQNIWITLCNTHNQNNHYLECHISATEHIDPDRYLIQSSSSALAASLSGVTGLCIHHPEVNNTLEFYNRIHRNIHHLLHLESRIYMGKDPLAGSYSIDFFTKKWAGEIWGGLLLP